MNRKARRAAAKTGARSRSRAPVNARTSQQRLVKVGGEIFGSTAWKTPADFLWTFLPHVLTPAWLNAEGAKPRSDQHPLVGILAEATAWGKSQARDAEGLINAVPSGSAQFCFQLAYDLYVLKHGGKLKPSVLARLRQKDWFQGTRYEVAITSIVVKAGLIVEHEDEADGSRRHVELFATDPDTNQRVAVEAKSRHRNGVLGFVGPTTKPKADIGKLLKNAIDKKPNLPFLIAVDLNLPPIAGPIFESQAFQEMAQAVFNKERAFEKQGRSPVTMYLLSNFPSHYTGHDPYPGKSFVTTCSSKPAHPFANPGIAHRLHGATQTYGRIPARFEDL